MFDDPVGAGFAAFPLPPSGLVAPIGPGFVVAIPVKDEDERLPAWPTWILNPPIGSASVEGGSACPQTTYSNSLSSLTRR
jgi:hypothetical protein